MLKDICKRKPNKRDEQESSRQGAALRDIERAMEIAMNSDVGNRTPTVPGTTRIRKAKRN